MNKIIQYVSNECLSVSLLQLQLRHGMLGCILWKPLWNSIAAPRRSASHERLVFLHSWNVHCKWITLLGVICCGCKAFDSINSSGVLARLAAHSEQKPKQFRRTNSIEQNTSTAVLHWRRLRCSSLGTHIAHIYERWILFKGIKQMALVPCSWCDVHKVCGAQQICQSVPLPAPNEHRTHTTTWASNFVMMISIRMEKFLPHGNIGGELLFIFFSLSAGCYF